MQQRLDLLSKRTESVRHAVVIMDPAGWYTDYVADDFVNLSIINTPTKFARG